MLQCIAQGGHAGVSGHHGGLRHCCLYSPCSQHSTATTINLQEHNTGTLYFCDLHLTRSRTRPGPLIGHSCPASVTVGLWNITCRLRSVGCRPKLQTQSTCTMEVHRHFMGCTHALWEVHMYCGMYTYIMKSTHVLWDVAYDIPLSPVLASFKIPFMQFRMQKMPYDFTAKSGTCLKMRRSSSGCAGPAPWALMAWLYAVPGMHTASETAGWCITWTKLISWLWRPVDTIYLNPDDYQSQSARWQWQQNICHFWQILSGACSSLEHL